MKSDPKTYAADIVDECLRRELRDGTLLNRCPDLVAAVQNWGDMMVTKLCNIEATMTAYEEDELIKRRLGAALNAFISGDSFKKIVAEYVESVLDCLVAAGDFVRTEAADGTHSYDWADSCPDKPE